MATQAKQVKKRALPKLAPKLTAAEVKESKRRDMAKLTEAFGERFPGSGALVAEECYAAMRAAFFAVAAGEQKEAEVALMLAKGAQAGATRIRARARSLRNAVAATTRAQASRRIR